MYLNSTIKNGLLYGSSNGINGGLWGHMDSDFVGNYDRRRSLTGYRFMLNACIINWKTGLQHVIFMSTIEAEYTKATDAVKETLWLKGMLAKLGCFKRILISTVTDQVKLLE